jgi:NADPH:quinone reductase-like Zn-dependent oxidoreductase
VSCAENGSTQSDLGGTPLKAIVVTKYGPPEVLQLRDVEKPTPKDNEVLIRVHATTVTSGDVRIRSSTYPLWYWLPARVMFGFTRPRRAIPGNELGGVIESVGRNVTRFKEGDQVFGIKWGVSLAGATAEYICLPEDGMIATRPASMTFGEAAAVPVGGLTALHFLRRADIQAGQEVLIFGASGSVGTFAVQLAKYFGAEVTGVCSTTNVGMVRSLGADRVIDYKKEDFTKGDRTYDVIFDAVYKTSFRRAKKSLKRGGIYLTVAWPLLQALWTSKVGTKKVVIGIAQRKPEDLIFLKELIEAGALKSVVDRSYPLEQTAEAHGYVEEGHKKGNVIITLQHGSKT